jgi:putative nucleotidyltransferase with HDIG domain
VRAATVHAAARAGTVAPSLVAAAADRLAAPSAVVRATLEAVDHERPSMHHVAERLAQSPELAAQVMRMGSGAIYGGPADTLDQAVVRIGTDNLRALLLDAGTYSLLKGSLPAYGLPTMALIRRSCDVATVARTVCERCAPAFKDQAYVAGLLHDIGMPILERVADEAEIPPPEPLRSLRAEHAHFGTDHTRVGAWIAHRWKLSRELADAVLHHHAAECPKGGVVQAVWLSSLIVDARTGDFQAAKRVADAAAGVGLADDVLESLLVGDDEPAPAERPPELTAREFEVLAMLAEGYAPKQVAQELGCSASTVHNHLHHVYRKLGVSGQAHALLLARERGWV